MSLLLGPADIYNSMHPAETDAPPAAAVPLLVAREAIADQRAEQHAAADAAAAAERSQSGDGASLPWSYGPPEATARGESNYISDENLLLWLAQKQEGLYGERRDHMDLSRERSKLTADLNHLKDTIDSTDDPAAVSAKVNELLEAYQGSDFEKELDELLVPLRESLDAAAVASVNAPGTDNDEITDITEAIKSKVEELGRDDQLELIQIQSLTADIREAGQLASNLIASSNQASNTIVGNIGR